MTLPLARTSSRLLRLFLTLTALVLAACLCLTGMTGAAAAADASAQPPNLQALLQSDTTYRVVAVPRGDKAALRAWFEALLDDGLPHPSYLVIPATGGSGNGGGNNNGNGNEPGDPTALLPGTPHETPLYIIRSGKPGPTLLVVGGVHGDKPAGVKAAEQLAEFDKLERGTLIVVPALDRVAVAAGTRSSGADLNRAFPSRSGQTPADPRAVALWTLMQDYDVDVLLDLHEAARPWNQADSLGNLIIFSRGNAARNAKADAMLETLNAVAPGDQPWRLGGTPISTGLTRAAADVLGIDSYYISTAKSNPLDVRVNQHTLAVMRMLAELDMADVDLPEPKDESGDQDGVTVTTRTLLSGTQHATTLYEIDSGKPGPTVFITGGVHGSELAGWKAAEQIAKWRVSRGRLIVIPHAFKLAVEQQRRAAVGYPDLNRQFPTSAGASPNGTIAQALWRELQRYRPDWVLDLHEAMSNRNLDSSSVGQTIIAHPGGGGQMVSMSNRIIARINPTLSSVHRFRTLQWPVQGSLARAAGSYLGANAAIVETSRMYDLNTRINWHLTLMSLLLDELDMLPASHPVKIPAA